MHLSERYCRWVVILPLMFVAQFSVTFVVSGIGVLAPLLRSTLQLSSQEVGTLTTAFFIGATSVCLAAGSLADRLGVKRPLVAVQLISGLAVVAISFSYSYRMLLSSMFLAGVADGAVMVLTSKAIVDWFPVNKRRGTAMGIKFVALSLSVAVAGVVLPGLALRVGLGDVFTALGSFLLFSALGSFFLYRDYTDPGLKNMPSRDTPALPVRMALWRNPNFLRLGSVGFLFGGTQYAFGAFLVPYLHAGGYSLSAAAGFLTIANVMAALSRPVCGWVSDRLLNGKRKPLLYWASIGGAGSLALMLLGSVSYVLLAGIMALFGFSALSYGVLYQTLAADLADRERGGRGAGIGIATTLVKFGSAVTPFLFGLAADTAGSYTASWGILIVWLLLASMMLALVKVARPAEL